MADRSPNDPSTRAYSRRSGSKSGWWIGGLIALFVVGVIAWIAWPNEDAVVTGTVPPAPAVEAPVVPLAAPAPVAPDTRP
ncbi:hypothetical protein [Microvirga roseola]|uniref:hypothetical protein n=1 Tax=Microvirga roseola TaxID=2883126 RepID=UPI001E48106F|nr:hypothetical protein [Microvirga roseola]